MAKFPALFVNHGAGPMPLLGKQPELVNHMRAVAEKLPRKPTAIVVLSAHWESDPVQVTNHPSPSMLYDYYGFPKEAYSLRYEAPGAPELAKKISGLLTEREIPNKLNSDRGFDHGVFIPLMMMFPDADIPTVCVSLHGSLSAKRNMEIGAALESLRDEGVLILGSGYTFHNLNSFRGSSTDTEKYYQSSKEFNEWLKTTFLTKTGTELEASLAEWDSAPGARESHPREEHLLPLFMTSAASGFGKAEVIFDETLDFPKPHAVTSYLFN